MTYKPLTDEYLDEMAADYKNEIAVERLIEQARRANRMEKALAALLKERGSTYIETEMRSSVDGTRIKIRTGAADIHVGEAALAAYRGETT